MKTKLLAAALTAASFLALPALADGPGRPRGGQESGRHERHGDQREQWRNDGRDQRDEWRNGGRDPDWRDDRRDDDWDRRHRHHHRYQNYRGPYHYYAPRWNSGRAWRDGWRAGWQGYRHRYAYGAYDRRHDHWDGRCWHRTYWDARGFFYYWDGDLMIRLRAW